MSFKAKKVTRSHIVELQAASEVVFPLLCPVREEEWIPGWEEETYELVYSQSGFNELGCIFRTRYLYDTESLWTCIKYDEKRYEIEFLIYIKDVVIRTMNILLNKNTDGTCSARFGYTDTAISEKGNIMVDSFSDDECQRSVAFLGSMINYFLQNGKKPELSDLHLA
ncbi:MAG: hypothetical protein ABFD08_09330 [Syntrophomonas sp.]